MLNITKLQIWIMSINHICNNLIINPLYYLNALTLVRHEYCCYFQKVLVFLRL